VWFSGLVTAGSDQRLPSEQAAQEQQIINGGKLILIGRFRDTNGDCIADERSLFVTHATSPFPNALGSLSDNGTVGSSWFITGNATSAASACLLHNSDYISADYEVLNRLTNDVQWLQPDDVTPRRLPFLRRRSREPVPSASCVCLQPQLNNAGAPLTDSQPEDQVGSTRMERGQLSADRVPAPEPPGLDRATRLGAPRDSDSFTPPSGPETETPMGFKFALVSTDGDVFGSFESKPCRTGTRVTP
jgi:hypothetical protein